MLDGRRYLAIAAAVGLMSLGSDCDEPTTKATGDPAKGTLWPNNPTYVYTQSETAISTNNVASSTVVSLTFNDGTEIPWQEKINYTQYGRTVYAGASQLGWSYSEDKGVTWNYGGRVLPPTGWSILWGDPSITNDPSDQNYVFISSLAVPNSKYPSGGCSGSMEAYLGGACIARSTDQGRSFSAYQCVTNNSHFYDGSSMAAGDLGVFAAYKDVTSGRIDVWRAQNKNSTFYQMADPFAGYPIADGAHPRLRYAGGRLYAATQSGYSGYPILLNRWSCFAGVCGWNGTVAGSGATALNPPITLQSGQQIRTGPQFSFDVGTGSDDTSIRLLYTTQDASTGRLYLRGSVCPTSTWSGCYDVPTWSSLSAMSGQQFNPLVRGSTRGDGTSFFYASFNSALDGTATGDNIRSIQAWLRGTFAGGDLNYTAETQIPPHPVCADTRGYWGDYDDLQVLDRNASGVPRFMRAFTDSSNGCQFQWTYDSEQVHVSTIIIN